MSLSSTSRRRCLTTLFLLLLAVACAPLPRDATRIVRGELDDRDYRYLELPNRMRVLLVSDPAADMAAAALQVQAGSGDDPAARQGLAHFLEHMLFLGTRKYPDPAEYQQFISEHGGSHNAYTAIDNTTYFLEIEPGSLDPALDRFAQFFIEPLFNAEYVAREMNAVDSEYKLGLKEDSRREFDVLRELVSPGHPLAKLGVGNLRTLGDGDIRKDLLDFYAARYSANLMTLVVLGREPVAALEGMVRARFTAVPDRSLAATASAPPLFAAGALPMEVQIRPEKDVRELSLVFPVPSARADYAAKPLEYIGNLLGHEGPGSLLSVLKARGWAEGLGSGSGFDMYGQDLFQINVQLTPAGLENYREVIGLVFAGIRRIRADGVEAWRFEEQGRLAALDFRFREKGSASGTVIGLANALREYPPDEVLRGPYLYSRFDAAVLDRYLALLEPSNLLVTLSHRGAGTTRESAWFHAPYGVRKLHAPALAAAALSAGASSLVLPQRNEFVPERVALKPAAGATPQPRLLVAAPRLRLWFQQDTRFGSPRGTVHLRLMSARADAGARESALADLYAHLVQDALNEYAYPATLAGLDYGLEAGARGITLQLAGYDDRQAVLLDKVLQAMRRTRFDPQRFDSLKRELLRSWGNAAKERPFMQVVDGLGYSLVEHAWAPAQLTAALAPLGPDDLAAFLDGLLREPAAEMLVYGNFVEADARRLAGMVEQAFGLGATGMPAVPEVAVAELPAATTLLREFPIEHADSAALFYIQGGEASYAERARMALTAQILGSRFFDELRTERQLGYAVFAQAYPLHRVPGLVLIVQSPVAGPERLAGEMEGFLARAAADGGAPDAAAFERHREALLDRLLEAPKSLQERGDRLWSDLGIGAEGFDDRERVAAAVRTLDLAGWQAWFRAGVAGPQRRAAFLYSRGHGPAAAAGGARLPAGESLQQWIGAGAKYYRFGWPAPKQDS